MFNKTLTYATAKDNFEKCIITEYMSNVLDTEAEFKTCCDIVLWTWEYSVT